MAKFEISDARTCKIEAGYTNNPKDRGNWTGGAVGKGFLIGTNFGISAPVLCKFLGRIATEQDMRGLTHEMAAKIRKVNYWDVMKGDLIIDQGVANDIYDNGINIGIETAIGMAQKDLNIKVTNKMDTKTLNSLNNA